MMMTMIATTTTMTMTTVTTIEVPASLRFVHRLLVRRLFSGYEGVEDSTGGHLGDKRQLVCTSSFTWDSGSPGPF